MTEPKTHGGRRTGAGRKPVPGPPRRRATIWLTEAHRARLLELGVGNLSRGVRALLLKEEGNAM